MLSPDQWNTALLLTTPWDIVAFTVSREVKAFLVQFDRESGYSTTELGNMLLPIGKVNPEARARFYSSLVHLRREEHMREWFLAAGTKKVYGREQPVYVWSAPDGATMPQGATRATQCPHCGSELF